MSYVTKYIATIVDHFKKTFKVKLKKNGYVGSATTITNGNATLSYRGDRDTESNILPSDVVFDFYVKESDNNVFDEILESEYKDWVLEITANDQTPVNNGYGLDSSNPSAVLFEIFDDANNKKWSFTNSPGENKPFNLSMTNSGNDYTVHWSNPTYNFTPQSFLVLYKHSQYFVSTFAEGSNLTSYTFDDLGDIEDNYRFYIAPCRQPSGVQPAEFSRRLTASVLNQNKPYNISAVTSGNSVVIKWANPTYSFPVQSFEFFRLRFVGGVWTSEGSFALNNNGSATSAVDLNIGLAHTGATYKYQIGVAALPNGIDRRVVSDFSNSVFIATTTIPPNIWFTGSVNTTNKYLGSRKIAPQLRVSGGSGTVIVKWRYSFTGTTAVVNETQNITATGGSFTIFLTGNTFTRNPTNPAARHTVTLLTGATYHIGVSNSNPTYTVPAKTQIPTFNLSQVGDDVNMSWSQVTDANSDVFYGYAVNRFLTSDFGNTNTVIAYLSGATNTSYSNVNAPIGNYTYYVRATSFNSSVDINHTSNVSELKPINIT
jgi:hypothetical protein